MISWEGHSMSSRLQPFPAPEKGKHGNADSDRDTLNRRIAMSSVRRERQRQHAVVEDGLDLLLLHLKEVRRTLRMGTTLPAAFPHVGQDS